MGGRGSFCKHGGRKYYAERLGNAHSDCKSCIMLSRGGGHPPHAPKFSVFRRGPAVRPADLGGWDDENDALRSSLFLSLGRPISALRAFIYICAWPHAVAGRDVLRESARASAQRKRTMHGNENGPSILGEERRADKKKHNG
jgi:hypothetical protein